MRTAFCSLLCLALLSIGTSSVAFAEKRVALVIGNGAYANATQLPNPRNDAEDVAAALKREGFETIVGIDLDQAKMQDTAIDFARAAREARDAIALTLPPSSSTSRSRGKSASSFGGSAPMSTRRPSTVSCRSCLCQ